MSNLMPDDDYTLKTQMQIWISECKQQPLYKATDWPSETIALELFIRYLNGDTPYQAILTVHSNIFPETEIQTP